MKISIQITSDSGSHKLTATLVDNSSATAFYELLKKGPLTVDMHDYGSFEKVGSLGTTLPRNDTQITTQAGDIILYQGNQITIYYDTTLTAGTLPALERWFRQAQPPLLHRLSLRKFLAKAM